MGRCGEGGEEERWRGGADWWSFENKVGAVRRTSVMYASCVTLLNSLSTI